MDDQPDNHSGFNELLESTTQFSLPISASALDYLRAIVHDETTRYEKDSKNKVTEGLQVATHTTNADTVNELLEIAMDLGAHITHVQDRLCDVLSEAIKISAVVERDIYRFVYWGRYLESAGERFVNGWISIDYKNLQPFGSDSPFALNEDQWQAKAGPLTYKCQCARCDRKFEQVFISLASYEHECAEIGTHFGLVVNLCASCKATLSKTAGYVYLVRSPSKYYKIGRTKKPKDRIKTFGIKLPFEVEYVCLIKTFDMYKLEQHLHDKYDSKRSNGEWFDLTEQDIEDIKRLQHAVWSLH